MAAVAGGAAAGAAVRIDVAHTIIGPGFRGGSVFIVQLDFGAVTLHASGLAGRAGKLRMAATLMHLLQGVQAVLGDDLAVGTVMPAGVELGFGINVATTADLGRHQRRDEYRRVLHVGVTRGVGGILRHLVAVDTGDSGMGMAAVLPVSHLARGGLLVTGDTCLALLTQVAVDFQRLESVLISVSERQLIEKEM